MLHLYCKSTIIKLLRRNIGDNAGTIEIEKLINTVTVNEKSADAAKKIGYKG